MAEVISTRSTSNETMRVSPIVLRETSTTRLIFEPIWVDVSDNPLRGGFRFQRKGPNNTWENFDSKPLASLHMDEEYKLNLKSEEICELLSKLTEINSTLEEHGHSPGARSVLLNQNNAEGIFLQIGRTENREWVIEQLKQLEKNGFENLGNAIGRAKLEKAIGEMQNNILNGDENFWQIFFESNTWLLQQVFSYPVIYLQGETYLGGKNSRGRSGSGGSATDFLLRNGVNSSFAVVEIKTPLCNLVGSIYRGEQGSGNANEIYRIHGDLSGGIVQMENQIFTAMSDFRSTIDEDFPDLNILDPVGVLIIGNAENLTVEQKKSFNLFRKSLGKNLVYTYDEILFKLELLKGMYE
ncbi:DUF4263 domain-containing protein [Candidatus Parcubacteria bacterium]|nr:DUF4263 domain-containing protein [Candidatus Parcubacteria bacterium]